MVILDLLLYAFTAVVFIQVVYYLFIFGSFAFLKQKKPSSKKIPVSVIVCAKNEAQNLKTFIPSIIEQDYPEFEIVLINDGSHDETLDVIEEFSKTHNNIKIVNVKNIEAFWGNKKYALTLGIKASKHDYLLFTDADCKPVSKYWIKDMSAHFNDKKSIVLGYGGYSKVKYSFLNKLIRFETVMTAVQYFSFAKIGLPYMGVGRNLAYTKAEFFNANGFIQHIKIRSGDDDLFINQVANSKNTAISFSNNSFTTSVPKSSYKAWYKQKRRHVSTAQLYKTKHKILLGLFYLSNVSFWLLAITLSITMYSWHIALGLFLLRLSSQYLILGFSSKKLKEVDVLLLLPILEISLILFQFAIFINNLISKPNFWK
ncbi:glycosyltransferase [Algibacter sp. Ld11]|uniref:glycosyltransferase n=1 Tax=Algibacter sp. Ld11 TaxID=649150 RepID=UPI003864383D